MSRIRGDIRFATRRERDFRIPLTSTPGNTATAAAVADGEPAGEARIEVGRETAWWVERAYRRAGRLEDGVFVTPYASVEPARCLGAASGRARGGGGAGRAAPRPSRPRSVDIRRGARGTGARAGGGGGRGRAGGGPRNGRPAPSRPSASRSCRRSSRTCSLPAGGRRQARIPASGLVERFHIPARSSRSTSLLNLVNFGGGCYTVYAELEGDSVRVDKELFGTRSVPRPG